MNIPVQGLRGLELIPFSGLLTSPVGGQTSRYEFGMTARQRTPADREDVLKRLIARMKEDPEEIGVVVKLESRSDWNTPPPELAFALANEKQAKIWSGTRADFECGERDLFCQIGLVESGRFVSFPLFLQPDSTPFITDKMRTVQLIITVGSQDEVMEFDLNAIN